MQLYCYCEMKSAWRTSRKNSFVKTRFNPYGRPSARALRGNLLAYEVRELQWGINASLMWYNWVLNIFRMCIWDPLWILTCPSVRVTGQTGHMVAQMPLFQGWTPRHRSGTYSLQLPDAEEKNSHPRPCH